MSAVLAFLGTKVGMGLLGALTVAAAVGGPKLVRAVVGREVGKLLKKALDLKTDDPVRREKIKKLVLAAVELAEYEIPDRGQGEKRKGVVMAALSRIIPKSQAALLSDLIEEAVVTMDEELKKQGQ